MVVLLLLWLALSALVGYIGRNRKFGFWGYFAISLLLSWMIGLLCVFASDPRKPATVATDVGAAKRADNSAPPTA
jgi:hypothetical protein